MIPDENKSSLKLYHNEVLFSSSSIFILLAFIIRVSVTETPSIIVCPEQIFNKEREKRENSRVNLAGNCRRISGRHKGPILGKWS
jgi:hypothetical protein